MSSEWTQAKSEASQAKVAGDKNKQKSIGLVIRSLKQEMKELGEPAPPFAVPSAADGHHASRCFVKLLSDTHGIHNLRCVTAQAALQFACVQAGKAADMCAGMDEQKVEAELAARAAQTKPALADGQDFPTLGSQPAAPAPAPPSTSAHQQPAHPASDHEGQVQS